jgi:hypothetical protein
MRNGAGQKKQTADRDDADAPAMSDEEIKRRVEISKGETKQSEPGDEPRRVRTSGKSLPISPGQ